MLRITLSANGSLYCCYDGVRARGAAVMYLSHNASFHSKEKIAPSNRGIKHLAIHIGRKKKHKNHANGIMQIKLPDELQPADGDQLRLFSH